MKRPLQHRSFKKFKMLRNKNKLRDKQNNQKYARTRHRLCWWILNAKPFDRLITYCYSTESHNFCARQLLCFGGYPAGTAGMCAVNTYYVPVLTPTTSAENVLFCGVQYSEYLLLRKWFDTWYRRRMEWRRSGNRRNDRMQTFAFKLKE